MLCYYKDMSKYRKFWGLFNFILVVIAAAIAFYIIHLFGLLTEENIESEVIFIPLVIIVVVILFLFKKVFRFFNLDMIVTRRDELLIFAFVIVMIALVGTIWEVRVSDEYSINSFLPIIKLFFGALFGVTLFFGGALLFCYVIPAWILRKKDRLFRKKEYVADANYNPEAYYIYRHLKKETADKISREEIVKILPNIEKALSAGMTEEEIITENVSSRLNREDIRNILKLYKRYKKEIVKR